MQLWLAPVVYPDKNIHTERIGIRVLDKDIKDEPGY